MWIWVAKAELSVRIMTLSHRVDLGPARVMSVGTGVPSSSTQSRLAARRCCHAQHAAII
jgi:hypothetical protein